MANTQPEVEHRPMTTRTQVAARNSTEGVLLYKSRCTCGFQSAWERFRKNAESDLSKHLGERGSA